MLEHLKCLIELQNLVYTDDDQFDGLKQFIANTVSQTETRLTQFVVDTVSQTEARLAERIDRLGQKVDDGFAGIAETIEQLKQRTVERDKAVDQRFTKLEGQLAA